jgi:hypothetical protein
VRPDRLARGQDLAGVERLGKVERAADQRALGRLEPEGERLERGRARLRMQADYGNHAVFYGHGLAGRMAAQGGYCAGITSTTRCGRTPRADCAFLPGTPKLRELALLLSGRKAVDRRARPGSDDAMRVSIAAQACLPILELGLDWYAGFTGIVVYPGDFRVRRKEIDEDGVVHEWDDELAGEAMPGGPVVLSWDAAAHDLQMNVVIHEFVHKLDMLSGAADGVPPLHAGMSRKAWLKVLDDAYQGFCDAVERGQDTWLDPVCRRAPVRILRGDQRGVLHRPGRDAAPLPGSFRSAQALLPTGTFMTTVRKLTKYVPLTREQFRERFFERFYDPAFDGVKAELEKICEISWDGYIQYRKSPRAQAAGAEFSDPAFKLPVEWLQARAAIQQAEKKQRDASFPSRILIVSGSTRSEHSCPARSPRRAAWPTSRPRRSRRRPGSRSTCSIFRTSPTSRGR